MANARVLKFHIQIPHKRIVDPYFFTFPSFAPCLNYVPLKTKSENLVCKIFKKNNIYRGPSYLVYRLGLRSRSPD